MTDLRFLGRSSIQLISTKDNLIIDPNFVVEPKGGIQHVFITHGREGYIPEEKLKELASKYSAQAEKEEKGEDEEESEKEELIFYGPKKLKDHLQFNVKALKSKKRIKFNELEVTSYEVDCIQEDKTCFAYKITRGEINVLHCSDTYEFSTALRDLKNQVDYCFISCDKDHFEDYIEFVREISPKITFPIYFEPTETENAKKLVEALNEKNLDAKFIDTGTEFEF
ncbi:MAG: hypothetical protein BAJALOKI2v1_320020 [Promethearchaeota archaeon]|nr:MAG: hypothetical protein BAJALOKI2v1_320020 [Candidatus Lokiarchaeota archaeon]